MAVVGSFTEVKDSVLQKHITKYLTGDDEEITKRGCKRFVEKKLHLKKNTVDQTKENKKKFKNIFKKTYALLQEEPEDEAKRQEESSVEQNEDDYDVNDDEEVHQEETRSAKRKRKKNKEKSQPPKKRRKKTKTQKVSKLPKEAKRRRKKKELKYCIELTKLRELAKAAQLTNPRLYIALKGLSESDQISHLQSLFVEKGVPFDNLTTDFIKQYQAEIALKHELEEITKEVELTGQSMRRARKNVKYTYSSQEEQESESEQEVVVEDETNKTATKWTVKAKPPPPESGSESDEGSEFELDEEDYNVEDDYL